MKPILIVDTMPRIAGFNPIERLKNIFRGYDRPPLEGAVGANGFPVDPLDERQVARFVTDSDTAQFRSGIQPTAGTNRGWHERAHIGDTINNKSVSYDPNWTQRGNSVGNAIPSQMVGDGSVSDISADIVAQVRRPVASSDRIFFAPPALVDPGQAPIRSDVNRGLTTANVIDITTDPQVITKQRHISGPVIGMTGDVGVTGVRLDELEDAGATLRNSLRNPSGVTSPGAVKFKSVPGSYHAEVVNTIDPVNRALDNIGNGIGRIAGSLKSAFADPVIDAGYELSEAIANKAAYNASKFGGRVITPAAALAIGGTAIAGHTLFNKLRNRQDESSIN